MKGAGAKSGGSGGSAVCFEPVADEASLASWLTVCEEDVRGRKVVFSGRIAGIRICSAEEYVGEDSSSFTEGPDWSSAR